MKDAAGLRDRIERQLGSEGDQPPAFEDDWLEADLDWFSAGGGSVERSGSDAGTSRSAGGRDADSSLERGPGRTSGPRRASSDVAHRRRTVALAVGGLLVVAAVVVPLVALSGNGDTTTASSPATTQASTTPVTTTPASTPQEPTTPDGSATQTPAAKPLRVELPEKGKLRRGDRGATVTQLQKALVALEYDPGTPDGVFGSQTESALVAFQEANKLDPDGVVGSKTAPALNAALTRAGVTE